MSDHADKLRRLIPAGDGHYSDYAAVLADAADYIDELLAERDALLQSLRDGRDALAQDAARYRWLRRSNNATLALHLARSECPERMDAEIDAAMAGREGA